MLFCLSISGKASEGNNDKKATINQKDSCGSQENDSIIGRWTLLKSVEVKTIYKNGTITKIESEMHCNVCPIIILKKSGEGILRNPSTVELIFNWIIDKDKMLFSFSKKSDENLFFSTDKKFEFKIYHDSKNHFLELTVTKDNYKYVLIR